MNTGQARDFLYNLTSLPALAGLKDIQETLEEISCLLDDVVNLEKHLERMPDIELEDSYDQKWVEKLQSIRDNLRSYGDDQFLENVAKGL